MVTLTIAPPCPMLLREAGSRRGRLQGTDGRMINRRTGSGKRARNPAGSRFKPGEPVRGTAGAIAAVLLATGTGTMINTAYIERLNATFRAASTPLTRRGRAIARTETTLQAGMFLVGCAYNFCWEHETGLAHTNILMR